MRLTTTKDPYYQSLVDVYEKNILEELQKPAPVSEKLLAISEIIGDYRRDGVAREDVINLLRSVLEPHRK